MTNKQCIYLILIIKRLTYSAVWLSAVRFILGKQRTINTFEIDYNREQVWDLL